MVELNKCPEYKEVVLRDNNEGWAFCNECGHSEKMPIIQKDCSKCKSECNLIDWKGTPEVVDDSHIKIISACLECGHEFTETYKIIKVDDVLLI